MAVVPVDGNVQVMATGAGQPVDIRSPGLGLTYIIALQGVYPSKE
jgi:microcystin-dependent protein